MSMDIEAQPSVEQIRKDLCNTANAAKTNFEVWWTQVHVARKRKLNVVQDYSDFFRVSQQAHHVAFVVCFANLFDKKNCTSSIKSYLTKVKSSTKHAKHSRWTKEYVVHEKLAEPLIQLRNKTVAHVDTTFCSEEFKKKYGISWEQARDRIYATTAFVASILEPDTPANTWLARDQRLAESTLDLIEHLPYRSSIVDWGAQ